MIAKISKGRGFRGLVEYLHQSQDGIQRGQLLATNLAGSTPREWAKQFGMVRRLRPTLGKAVFHASLSPSPNDPQLTDEQYENLARVFLDGMGFTEETPFVVIKHDHQTHTHIHIAASRITPSGEVVSDARDFQRAEAIVRNIEAMHGLRPVVASRTQKASKRHKRRDNKAMNHKTVHDELPGQPAAADCQEHTSGEVAESWSDARRREARRQLLDDEYRDALRQMFGDDVSFIRRNRNRPSIFIRFKDGASLYDDGDRLRIDDRNDENAARRMVLLAVAKGWTAVSFSGHRIFVKEAMKVALLNGLQVIPKSPEQAALLEEVMKEQSSVGGTGSPRPTPSPVPSPASKPAPPIDMNKLAAFRQATANPRPGTKIRRR